MHQGTLEDARSRALDLLEETVRGEGILIVDGSSPVAMLTPIDSNKPERIFGTARGQMWMSNDFDEPLEGFEEYMPCTTH